MGNFIRASTIFLVCLLISIIIGVILGKIHNKFVINRFYENNKKLLFALTMTIFILASISMSTAIQAQYYVNYLMKSNFAAMEQYIRTNDDLIKIIMQISKLKLEKIVGGKPELSELYNILAKETKLPQFVIKQLLGDNVEEVLQVFKGGFNPAAIPALLHKQAQKKADSFFKCTYITIIASLLAYIILTLIIGRHYTKKDSITQT